MPFSTTLFSTTRLVSSSLFTSPLVSVPANGVAVSPFDLPPAFVVLKILLDAASLFADSVAASIIASVLVVSMALFVSAAELVATAVSTPSLIPLSKNYLKLFKYLRNINCILIVIYFFIKSFKYLTYSILTIKFK